MELSLIYARSRNGVIGSVGTMPWHIPEDLAHFRAMTLGCVVIMGRKTWESLPGPLGGRVSIVITRNPALSLHGANVYRAGNLKEALEIARQVVDTQHAGGVWVIGGAEIFKEALPQASLVEVTEIDADCEGDTFAPKLGRQWVEADRREQSTAGVKLSFVTYVRRKPSGNRLFQTAGRYLFWLLAVQLIAWSPAILNAFDVVSLTMSVSISMLLSTAGAIWLIDLAKSGIGQLRSRFQPTNHKE
jgi:dihydrofolate reductase